MALQLPSGWLPLPLLKTPDDPVVQPGRHKSMQQQIASQKPLLLRFVTRFERSGTINTRHVDNSAAPAGQWPERDGGKSFLQQHVLSPAGYVKGYALVEYALQKEAKAAIDALDGQELLTQAINVTWAFSQGPIRKQRPAPRGRR